MRPDEMIARLEKRIATQRESGGDLLFYGKPDPLDVGLLTHLVRQEGMRDRNRLARRLAALDPEIGERGWDILPATALIGNNPHWCKDYWHRLADMVVGIMIDGKEGGHANDG